MKWMACYVVGAVLLVTPLGMRFLFRSEAAPTAYSAEDAKVGEMLFTHHWTANDSLSPNGDGVGPVFNAFSCAECHTQGGLGGSGGAEHNVTTFFRPGGAGGGQSGVIHVLATSTSYQENLSMASPDLPATSRPTLLQIRDFTGRSTSLVRVSQRNTPALFGAALIDALTDDVILAQERAQKLRWHEPTGVGDTLPVGRALHVQGGAVGKFGWKSQNATLFEFVQGACANELGLSNPGQAQPQPLSFVDYKSPGLDLTNEQCGQMTAFIAKLKRPVEVVPADAGAREQVHKGRQLFNSVGCAECHVSAIGSLEGIYSDLLVHRMGPELTGSAGYYVPREEIPESPGDTPLPDEWRTPPLWGVSDSGPYMHDGRASTLPDAIRAHGGQGTTARDNFNQLNPHQQEAVVDFMKSLRAPG